MKSGLPDSDWQVISLSLSLTMNFFTLFSLPVMLRVRGWLGGGLEASQGQPYNTWTILTATDSLHMQSKSTKYSFVSATQCLGVSVSAVASSHIVRNLAILAKMW